MFILQTIEDFDNLFPTEKEARDFLWAVREKYSNCCPICKCEKLYKNNNGINKKCAACKTNISVTVSSIMDGTKLPLQNWLKYIFLHAKTKGRFLVSGTKSHTFLASLIIDDKIKRIFYLIDKNNNPTIEAVFFEAVKNLFHLTAKDLRRKESLKTYMIDPNEVYDISDSNTYNKILLFATKQMYFALHKRWIFEVFIEPSSLLAEAYINIKAADIQVLKGSIIVDSLQKTQNRLWYEHIKNTPRLSRYFEWYGRDYRRKGRRNLADTYIKRLIKDATRNKNEWATELPPHDLAKTIIEKRDRIQKLREKRGELSNIDFNLY